MSTVDPTVRTSRVFAATLAVFDRIKEVAFPDNPTTGETPGVFLFRDPGTEHREFISVLLNDDPATSEWVTAGPATSDELIVVDVLIRSMIPGHVGEEAGIRDVVERLEVLADRVQLIAYDTTAGKPKPLGFTNETTVGRAVSVSFGVQHTEEGYVGDATVQFLLRARI